MGVAEDTHKISNIVTPNLHHFRSLYEEILDNEEHLLWDKNSGKFEQIPDFSTRWVSHGIRMGNFQCKVILSMFLLYSSSKIG